VDEVDEGGTVGQACGQVRGAQLGEDNKLLDYLPGHHEPGPDDEIFEHALTESIEGVLATLKEREAKDPANCISDWRARSR